MREECEEINGSLIYRESGPGRKVKVEKDGSGAGGRM